MPKQFRSWLALPFGVIALSLVYLTWSPDPLRSVQSGLVHSAPPVNFVSHAEVEDRGTSLPEVRRLTDEQVAERTALEASTTQNYRPQRAAAEIAMPVVLALPEASPSDLSETEAGVIQDLQQEFAAEVGGSQEDPQNPAYAERWRKAQPESDARLRLMLGSTTADRLETEVAAAAGGASK